MPVPPHSCLGIAASGGCESHVCLWRISTLQPVVMHWAEDFHGFQIGSFASDFLLSDPPLWCIAGCTLVYTFWQVQPILARREWTRESTSEEMERPEFSVCDYLKFKRLLEQAFGGYLKEYTFKTADHKLPLKCNEIHEGFKQWSVMQNTPAFAHGRRVVQDWYCITTSYKHLKWVSLKSAKTIWQMWKRHEKTRTETTWWDAEQHWPVFWHCSQAFLGNIKARDPCRAMARICLRRKFQAGASVVHLVKCTQVQEHIFTVICLMRYMNYISYYARLRHPEALVIGTGPMPLFRPLGLVYLASREHSCRGLKQHHHA